MIRLYCVVARVLVGEGGAWSLRESGVGTKSLDKVPSTSTVSWFVASCLVDTQGEKFAGG